MIKFEKIFGLWIIFLFCCSKGIILDIHREHDKYLGHPYIELSFGTPPQRLELVIDITRSISCLADSTMDDKSITAFHTKNSNTLKIDKFMTTLLFKGGRIAGKEYNDFLVLNNANQSNARIKFILLDYFTLNRKEFDNLVGLKMSENHLESKDDKSQLINVLYNNDIIKDRLFGISYNKLYLGETPPDLNMYSKYTCSSDYNGHYWSCNVHKLEVRGAGISFDLKGTEKIRALFSSRELYSVVPSHIGEKIFEYYFKIKKVKDNCHLTEKNFDDLNYFFIQCKTFDYLGIEGVELTLEGGYRVKIEGEDLFFAEENLLTFAVAHCSQESFEISSYFFRKELVVFDMKKKTVTFSTWSGINFYPFSQKKLFLGELSLCSFGILFCLVSLIKSIKNKVVM